MGKFINPFTDVGFKKIFGQEVSKDLLIDFLNDLLVGERSIKDITFLDKELLPEYMGDRGVIYDIYCTTEAGEHIIVEMQNRQQTNFKERALFYLSHTITRQGEKGARWEFDLKAVYGVFFMNFRLEDTPHKLRTDIVLSDRDTHEVFSDKLRFIFIELPSFNKEEEECETDFERWIYILKNMETLNRLPFKARKAVFEKLEKIVDIASLSKEERMKYDESIKVYRDNLATISFAKNQGKEQVKQHRLKEPDKSKYEIYTAVKNEIGKSRNWKQLQHRLAEKGITIQFKRKGQTDEIQGISFSKGEYTFKGSEIDRSFSFSKLDRYFGDTGLNVAESQRQTAFAPIREQIPTRSNAESPFISGSLGLFSASPYPVDEEPNLNLRKKKKKKKQLKL